MKQDSTYQYWHQNKIDIKVMRIFNTYGPHMHSNDGMVVSNFILQALRGEEITVYGDGSQTRSFCYVDDMVEGIIRMMEYEENPIMPDDPYDHTQPSLSGFPVPINLGNPREITILELSETILDLVGSGSKIIIKPLPKDDPIRRKPDITLAKEKLGWAPRVGLEEGLKKTVKYFEDLLEKT